MEIIGFRYKLHASDWYPLLHQLERNGYLRSFPPLVFLGGFWVALIGLLFWGTGYATQDTLLKAVIASVLPEGKRNLAFGLFYLGYGGGWLVGSVTTGLLYERSRPLLIAFAIAVQLASLPVFWFADRATVTRRKSAA